MPIKPSRIHINDAPWVTPEFKQLIKLRQQAFTKGDKDQFRRHRNEVNRQRKVLRERYYSTKVKDLGETKPSQWWNAVKHLSGMSPFSGTNSVLSNLQIDDLDNLSEYEIANLINTAFLDPMKGFQKIQPLPPLPIDPTRLILSENDVLAALSKLNHRKACGPDGVPPWLLKEYADILARPITSIINSSFAEQRCPEAWKRANIVPIPKQRPVTDINKHLRPVSLTDTLSKLAEEFIVHHYIGPAVLKIIDPDQYGGIPKSSTLHAVTSMIHHLSQATDGTGAAVRLILVDYRKAFDLIDHTLLMEKVYQLDIPRWVSHWLADFLTDRHQRVRLSGQCLSDWSPVTAGTPQGTKIAPWLFLLMINDLKVPQVRTWKYIDDTTIAEVVPRETNGAIQEAVAEIVRWTDEQKMQLNADKCKELVIDFKKHQHHFNPISIGGKELSKVTCAKILGITISDNLKWNIHVDELIKKANKRLYFLVQLRRAGVNPKEIARFYSTVIRPLLEYCSPAFHHSLPGYLSDDIERVQKRAMSIIAPHDSYTKSLENLNLSTLLQRRQDHCDKLFKNIIDDPQHNLNDLLPQRHISRYNTRHKRAFNLPRCKTKRYMNTFIPAMCFRDQLNAN